MLQNHHTQNRPKANPPHLFKRRNSENWQLRLAVPPAARGALGRTEFTKSLGVTNRSHAVDLSHAVLADWKATISAALASSSPVVSMGVNDIADIAVEVGFQIATARVPDLVTRKAKEGAAAFDDLKARFARRHHEAIRLRRAGELSYWIERARKLLVERNLPFTDSDPQFTTLVEHLATSGTDTFAYAKAYMDGSEHLFRPSPLIATVQQRGKAQVAKVEGIAELYERYAVQRLDEGRQRPDTINQGRKVISMFVEFVGNARAVNTLKSSDVREWRNTIKVLPPAFRARKENRNLSFKDAANLAVKNGLTGISIITVNKYLSTLSPFLNWVRQEGYADINPCDGLFYDVQKIKRNRKRPPFEPNQMNAILKSPLFTGFHKDGKEWIPGDCHAYDWRRWIPLVCMFTGARIGEIAQLCFGDVCEEDGIPFLWLRHDEKTGQTNKSGQSRPSVIHTKLGSKLNQRLEGVGFS